MVRMRAVCLGVQATLAISTSVTCLIVVCVAGAALSQLTVHIDIPNPPPTPEPGTPDRPPLMGKPAAILALVAAFPSLFMTLGIAMVRVLQIRLTGITFSNPALALIFSYLMMFFGVVFIAAFGAAGVLSAIAATYQIPNNGDYNPGPSDYFQEAARNYLIGTSVSSFVAFLMMICFMLYELFAGLWTDTKKDDYTEIQ